MILDWFSQIDWGVLAQVVIAISTAFLAGAAIKGLSAWKKQDSTKIKVKFLDDLVYNVHGFRNAIVGPITYLLIIKIQLDVHKNHSDASEKTKYIGEYVKASGKQDSKKLNELMAPATSYQTKILELATKGSVLGLKNFDKCKFSCDKLVGIFNQLTIVSTLILAEGFNYSNPEIAVNVEKLIKLNPSELQNEINESEELVLNYAKETYLNLLS